jgi:hypothetical protein
MTADPNHDAELPGVDRDVTSQRMPASDAHQEPGKPGLSRLETSPDPRTGCRAQQAERQSIPSALLTPVE